MSYQLVEDLQKKAYPKVAVSQACRVLEVSRSGYYASVAAHRQGLVEPVVCAASVHLKAAFAASHKAYGSRRLRTAMAERGLAMGRHRVRTLMRLNGLRPVWRRKFVHTTDSKHTMAVSRNVLNRQFDQALPNQAWVCDITYIRTRSGWLYLAAVLDLHSRKIVGWAMSPAMPAGLVCAALQMAIVQRNPAPGLIVHSDRGTQGVFNRSSQHWIVDWILDIYLRLRLVSSSRAISEAWCSAHWRRRGSPGRSIGTGRYPWGSIAVEGHSCSRSSRAAMGCGDRQRRLLSRTQS